MMTPASPSPTAPPAVQPIHTFRLDCGMTLVVEPISTVSSVALNWLLPIGAATDPLDGDGHAALLSELITRGAGGRSAREHSDALDLLGVQRGCEVQTHHMRLEGTLLGDRLAETLPLLADMVIAPTLAAESLPPVRNLCLQELQSLDDDPQTLAMLRLRENHNPPPFNRHGYGEAEVLAHAGIEEIRASWHARCKPAGSILGVAGAADPHRLADQLNHVLRNWQGSHRSPRPYAPPTRGYEHLEQNTAQMHIGVAWDAPPERDPLCMVERLAVGALSGSTSARLFTEVRQKRSLCYSVGACYRAGKETGSVTLYAGTTPERAQETLDVCLQQVHQLKAGITQAEFHRAVVGLKSHLIMQGESTAARASALVYDQFRLERARTLDEVAAQIDAVTIEQVNDYIASREFGQFTVVSIGPAPLDAGGAAAK